MAMQMMTMAAMEAAPDMQAGEYGASLWFRFFINMVERQFPGAGELIEKASEFIPWAKLLNAVLEAYRDWQAGKDFMTILKEALSEWLDIPDVAPNEPIRMALKPTE